MNYQEIQEVIKTMINSDLSSLELEFEGVSLKLRRGAGEEREIVKIEPEKKEAQKVKETPVKSNEGISEAAALGTKPQTADSTNIKVINSPIVGTFYASAGPDKDNFVSVGSKVKKGQTLCIIEAMKLMNEIDSEVNGEVVEILVSNEQMVEYNQPLFKIKVEG